MARALALGAEIGCLLIVVDAIDERAAAFYERHDFRRFPGHPDKLFLLAETAARLLAP